MIITYKLWSGIEKRLLKEFPDKLKTYHSYNDIVNAIRSGFIKKSDPIIFLGMTQGDFDLQSVLAYGGYTLYPSPEFSSFIRQRKVYLPKLDNVTNYRLKRVFTDLYSTLPSLLRENFDYTEHAILKAGDFHASEGKWLIPPYGQLPRLKHKYHKHGFLLEEFIPNARSIRIGVAGDPRSYQSIFITEHSNSRTWLKNNNPEQELTYSYADRHNLNIPHIDCMITEVLGYAMVLRTSLLGVDFVVNDCRTGLLELNDMIGLPSGDFAFELFYSNIRRILLKGML